MAAAAGQAAGLAVGAAVGSIVGQPVAGAAIGSGIAGFIGESKAGKIQGEVDAAALALNQEQARLKAAETSAIHAANFRQALASQVSLAAMRGGSGSLVTQFGQQAFRNFLQEQKAIETGLSISEVQGDISKAGLSAQEFTRNITAATRLASNAFSGLNLNQLKPRES